jgi:hypothetical protein
LYRTRNDTDKIRQFEKTNKIRFERLPVPRSDDVAQYIADQVVVTAKQTQPEMMHVFESQAKDMLDSMTPENAVASLLAVSSRVKELGDRSAVTGKLGMSTLHVQSNMADFSMTHRNVEALVTKMQLPTSANFHVLRDDTGFLLDVPQEFKETVTQKLANEQCQVLAFEHVPEIKVSSMSRGGDRGSSGYGQRSGGGDRRGGSSRSFDRSEGSRPSFRSGDRNSGDRPSFRSFDRSDGDRPPRSFDRSSGDRPPRSFDRSSGDRPPRSFDGSRPSFRSSDRPPRNDRTDRNNRR